jgi:FkbM family methyltransferase
MSSWSLSFARKYFRYMSVLSLIRYRAVMVREKRAGVAFDETITLSLRHPLRGTIVLRPSSNDSFTFDEIFVEQVYRELFNHVPDAKTCIDLGANIGLATLYLAAKYRTCRFVCVEPEPHNYRLLHANVRPLVATDRCRTLRAAVWSTNTDLVMNPLESAGHVNQVSVREDKGGKQVKGLSMAKIMQFAGFEKVDILKVDIEGSEVPLFSGDVSWLAKMRSLAIEFHGGSREHCGFDAAMQKHGFRVLPSAGHTVIAIK